MSENFQKNIQNWVSIDNKIKMLNMEVKELRQTKNNLTDQIFVYAENNNLENAVIQISDGKLKFQNVKSNSPLTYKLVKECLSDIIDDEKKVISIVDYIKKKRETKYSYDIKRSYN